MSVNDPKLREIVRAFFDAKVVEISAQKPFVLASGKEAPVYMDHRLVFSEPSLRKRVVTAWTESLTRELKRKIDPNVVIAGTASAGIAPAYAMAEVLGCRFVYVRTEAKDHGQGRLIEGLWNPGTDVIVVDDMITTGRSLLKAAEHLRAEGGRILAATSISRHDFRATKSTFQKANIPLHSLFSSTDIFDIAFGLGLIDSRDMRAVMQWMSDEDLRTL